MFHPAFTAPPGNGTLSASFEAFLVNASTGAAVPGVDSAPFTLTWTVVPDGRPALILELAKAQSILVAWPAAATNYVLESADTLPSSAWTLVTNAPVWQEGKPTVLQDANVAMKFFRLRRAP
jgi:hypothetical protein